VSAGHIGEQTNTESEGLREETEDLDGDHNRPKRPVDTTREMCEVMRKPLRLDGGYLDHEKCNDGESRRDHHIARRGCTKRHQADKIHRQNEEKCRQELGQIHQSPVTHIGENDLVPDEHNECFNKIRETVWDRFLADGAGRPDREDGDQDRAEQQEKNMFGNGEVDRDPTDLEWRNRTELDMPERDLNDPRVTRMVEEIVVVEWIVSATISGDNIPDSTIVLIQHVSGDT
jgi:hypothetical protein